MHHVIQPRPHKLRSIFISLHPVSLFQTLFIIPLKVSTITISLFNSRIKYIFIPLPFKFVFLNYFFYFLPHNFDYFKRSAKYTLFFFNFQGFYSTLICFIFNDAVKGALSTFLTMFKLPLIIITINLNKPPPSMEKTFRHLTFIKFSVSNMIVIHGL